MKNQALFSSKKIKLKCRPLQFLFGTLRVKTAFFHLQTMFTTNIMPSKHAGSIIFYKEWLGKGLCLCSDG